MKFTDLLIIYFACGAPFGVYQITTAPHPVTAKAALLIVLRICFWPVFAVLTLIEWFSKKQHSSESNLDRRIDSIRNEIESLVFDSNSISSIFDFREILHRYAGLSAAAITDVVTNAANEVFELGNSDRNVIASACLARKNQRKLSFHQTLARDEFVDMISAFANANRGREKILMLAVKLANSVNDAKAATALTAMISETQLPTMASESEIPIIKSHSASSPV